MIALYEELNRASCRVADAFSLWLHVITAIATLPRKTPSPDRIEKIMKNNSIKRTHINFENRRLRIFWWPFKAFAQESLKTVTSPTSYRKYPQKGPNLGLPRMFIFFVHFYFQRNQIALSI